ncbi:MAG: DUF2238 domain-containing protein [Planctomycetia bacterium]|nr:DUF2238 domain-containing protein [Planctomycetia bacterium]
MNPPSHASAPFDDRPWYVRAAIPRDPVQRLLFALFLVCFCVSCINPPYLQFMLMQHAPTLPAAFLLCFLANRFEISRLSFGSILLFLALHTLGARYLYSYTPYDDWARALMGRSISELFGFERNHFDRMVHFSYGLLLAIPIQEFERRHLGLSLALSSVLAVECILATSALYEIIEWLVAVVFTPEWADHFLGMQGDVFDGQKDMALATAGAMISIGVMAAMHVSRTWGRK